MLETEYCKAILFFGKKIPLERSSARTGRQRKLRPTVCLSVFLVFLYIYTFNKTLVSSLILLQFLVFLSYMWKREKVKFFPRYFFITKHYFPRYDTKIHKPLKETVPFFIIQFHNTIKKERYEKISR